MLDDARSKGRPRTAGLTGLHRPASQSGNGIVIVRTNDFPPTPCLHGEHGYLGGAPAISLTSFGDTTEEGIAAILLNPSSSKQMPIIAPAATLSPAPQNPPCDGAAAGVFRPRKIHTSAAATLTAKMKRNTSTIRFKDQAMTNSSPSGCSRRRIKSRSDDDGGDTAAAAAAAPASTL
ncbi:hypothetical protein KC345_g244 [Hortaea werneckii]|nr:hypothetical protein KC345_g244 [Hortaea werneckii]